VHGGFVDALEMRHNRVAVEKMVVVMKLPKAVVVVMVMVVAERDVRKRI
jgi:hypothetical protein